MQRESLLTARDTIASKLEATTVLINAAGGNRPDATLPPGSDFCKLPLEAWRNLLQSMFGSRVSKSLTSSA